MRLWRLHFSSKILVLHVVDTQQSVKQQDGTMRVADGLRMGWGMRRVCWGMLRRTKTISTSWTISKIFALLRCRALFIPCAVGHYRLVINIACASNYFDFTYYPKNK